MAESMGLKVRRQSRPRHYDMDMDNMGEYNYDGDYDTHSIDFDYDYDGAYQRQEETMRLYSREDQTAQKRKCESTPCLSQKDGNLLMVGDALRLAHSFLQGSFLPPKIN